METLETPLHTDAIDTNGPAHNDTDSSQPAEKPTPPANESVGGMTLKKRAPGTQSSTSSTGPSGPRPIFTPRDGTASHTLRPAGSPNNAAKRMERFSRVMPTRDPGVRMNENIRVPEIRVIDDDGQVGVMSPKEALEIARSRGVDLIEIVPNAVPPVCKLIDFGKWKYEQQKRDKLAKKSAHTQLIKEVRFHPNTDTHDFEFKVRHARNFLLEGNKVKATVQFKGREVAYKQFGEELLREFHTRLADLSKVDQDLSMMGRMMTMVLSPSVKKKKEEGSKKTDGKKDSNAVAKDPAKEAAKEAAKEQKARTEFAEKLEAARKVMAEAPIVPEEASEQEEEFIDDTAGLEDVDELDSTPTHEAMENGQADEEPGEANNANPSNP